MDERTKLIDWAARNHETKWAALQWLYDAAVAAERERCAKLETEIREALKQARAYPWASGTFVLTLEDALRPNAEVSGAGTASAGLPGYALTGEKG